MATPFETDWSNVDLENESHLNLVDGMTFDTLLLEIHTSITKIDPNTVSQHFEERLQNIVSEAREIFADNLKNIVKHSKKKRANQ